MEEGCRCPVPNILVIAPNESSLHIVKSKSRSGEVSAFITIDHVELVRVESSCPPSYLIQYPSPPAENIHQYISLCVRKMYLVIFLFYGIYET
jgi:hypothetical protein